MNGAAPTRIPEAIQKHEAELLADWIAEQTAAAAGRRVTLRDAQLREQCTEFLRLLRQAMLSNNLTDISREEWAPVREMLAGLSRSRGQQGFSPSETATFVFSFKKPLFVTLRRLL